MGIGMEFADLYRQPKDFVVPGATHFHKSGTLPHHHGELREARCLKAVEAIRNAGCEVVGMAAIFTYGFPVAVKRFSDAGVKLITLSNYNSMLEAALETDYIKPDDLETLKLWRKDPANWVPVRKTE